MEAHRLRGKDEQWKREFTTTCELTTWGQSSYSVGVQPKTAQPKTARTHASMIRLMDGP